MHLLSTCGMPLVLFSHCVNNSGILPSLLKPFSLHLLIDVPPWGRPVDLQWTAEQESCWDKGKLMTPENLSYLLFLFWTKSYGIGRFADRVFIYFCLKFNEYNFWSFVVLIVCTFSVVCLLILCCFVNNTWYVKSTYMTACVQLICLMITCYLDN